MVALHIWLVQRSAIAYRFAQDAARHSSRQASDCSQSISTTSLTVKANLSFTGSIYQKVLNHKNTVLEASALYFNNKKLHMGYRKIYKKFF